VLTSPHPAPGAVRTPRSPWGRCAGPWLACCYLLYIVLLCVILLYGILLYVIWYIVIWYMVNVIWYMVNVIQGGGPRVTLELVVVVGLVLRLGLLIGLKQRRIQTDV
jgi:hypothetical protein